MGDAYLFTADGLFVAQLFQDSRTGKPWTMPMAERGTLLNDLTLHDENFFPTISQTSDGQVYLCNGSRMSLVRIDGLDSIRRLPTTEFEGHRGGTCKPPPRGACKPNRSASRRARHRHPHRCPAQDGANRRRQAG